MSEFEEVMDTIENCQARYKNEFISYMQQRSADAQQRSADAQQRSADAQQRSADAQQRSADAQQSILKSLNKSLDAIIEFYKLYDISPDPDRLRTFKKDVQELITRCKQD